MTDDSVAWPAGVAASVVILEKTTAIATAVEVMNENVR
jgi:hypothetical protein